MRSRLQSWSVALAVLWLGAGGCYWLRYDALVRTHVDLLVAMVTKLEDVTERSGPPARMAEYRYPLVRARDFVRIVEGRFAGRASLGELRALCDEYEAALDAAVRGPARGAATGGAPDGVSGSVPGNELGSALGSDDAHGSTQGGSSGRSRTGGDGIEAAARRVRTRAAAALAALDLEAAG